MTEKYFKEIRLYLTKPGEFFVRLFTYSFYAVLIAGAALLLFSDMDALRWGAVLVFLFLLDRLLHFGEAEKALFELKGTRINIALATTPASYRALSYAFRRARAAHENFY